MSPDCCGLLSLVDRILGKLSLSLHFTLQGKQIRDKNNRTDSMELGTQHVIGFRLTVLVFSHVNKYNILLQIMKVFFAF